MKVCGVCGRTVSGDRNSVFCVFCGGSLSGVEKHYVCSNENCERYGEDVLSVFINFCDLCASPIIEITEGESNHGK